MRLALLSDVHANLRALQAVLRAAEDAGCDELVFLGDAIDYGSEPNGSVQTLAANCAHALAGNHDLLAVGATDASEFSTWALEAAAITAHALTDASRGLLASWAPAGSHRGIRLAHGSPSDPVWGYLDQRRAAEQAFHETDATFIAVGHTHRQRAYRARADQGGRVRELSPLRADAVVELGADRWVLNPGSVGRPHEKHDARACWALIDLARGTLTMRRSAYDWRAEREAILAAGLPSSFARGLGA